jgi:outer membrane cobalamin receptor
MEGQTIPWSTDTKVVITSRKRKDRQYNDQKKNTDNTMTKIKRQTIQWPKEKDKKYNDQKKKTEKTMTKRKRTKKQKIKKPIGPM